MKDLKDIISFIQSSYSTKEFIPLHEPRFMGNEKKYLLDTIDSTFVSSVGAYVDRFEEMMQEKNMNKSCVYAIALGYALENAEELV